MPATVDVYVPGESWAHKADPRVKLLFVAAGLLLLLLFKNIYLMLFSLALLLLIFRSAGIPGGRALFIARTLLPISLLIAGIWVIFYPTGEPILTLWRIRVTPLGIVQGLVLALRINAMALLIFAWLYTTDHPAIVRSLVKLRLPFEWGLVLALALRYIPTFQATYTVISQAQQARGLRLEGSGFRRVRLMMPIFVAMIISALRASEQLARALDARAFGARGVERTYYRDLHFRPLDWLYAGLILALAIGVLYLNIQFGLGRDPLLLL